MQSCSISSVRDVALVRSHQCVLGRSASSGSSNVQPIGHHSGHSDSSSSQSSEHKHEHRGQPDQSKMRFSLHPHAVNTSSEDKSTDSDSRSHAANIATSQSPPDGSQFLVGIGVHVNAGALVDSGATPDSLSSKPPQTSADFELSRGRHSAGIEPMISTASAPDPLPRPADQTVAARAAAPFVPSSRPPTPKEERLHVSLDAQSDQSSAPASAAVSAASSDPDG